MFDFFAKRLVSRPHLCLYSVTAKKFYVKIYWQEQVEAIQNIGARLENCAEGSEPVFHRLS